MPYVEGKMGLTPELHAAVRERLCKLGLTWKAWVNLMAERYLSETANTEPPPGHKPDRRTLGGWGKHQRPIVPSAVADTLPAPSPSPQVTSSGGEVTEAEMEQTLAAISDEQIRDVHERNKAVIDALASR